MPRGGEGAFTGTSGFRKARLYGFAVRADRRLVHEMWSRYIARPSQDLGLPLDGLAPASTMCSSCSSTASGTSTPAGYRFQRKESEQLFAIVVFGLRMADPGLVLFRALSLCLRQRQAGRAEREIYGYPRVQGSVRDTDRVTGTRNRSA